jgi:hypothetical protein
VKVLRAGLSDGLEGRSVTLAHKWLKFFRHLNHRQRPLNKLPFLVLAIGISNVVEKVASYLAQPCGKLPPEFFMIGHWQHLLPGDAHRRTFPRSYLRGKKVANPLPRSQ